MSSVASRRSTQRERTREKFSNVKSLSKKSVKPKLISSSVIEPFKT
ncbi:hypothetical protein KIPB_014434, partial [Kipferlia bialata]|eukprot:g14434.t1